MLGFWLGGACKGIAPTQQASVRGMLAPWIGGAASPYVAPPIGSAGVRGMLGFWVGGAASGAAIIPPAPTPELGRAHPPRWPWRYYKKCADDEEEFQCIVDALPATDAARVNDAVNEAVIAVSQEQPTAALECEEIFQRIVLHVHGEVRSAVTEILNDNKIRRKRLRELFAAEIERQLEEEELILAFANLL